MLFENISKRLNHRARKNHFELVPLKRSDFKRSDSAIKNGLNPGAGRKAVALRYWAVKFSSEWLRVIKGRLTNSGYCGKATFCLLLSLTTR